MFEKLPSSTRKFIRSEKARIRRQFLDYKAQEEAIANMYNKLLNSKIKNNENSRYSKFIYTNGNIIRFQG